jgi:hypothetical protein
MEKGMYIMYLRFKVISIGEKNQGAVILSLNRQWTLKLLQFIKTQALCVHWSFPFNFHVESENPMGLA